MAGLLPAGHSGSHASGFWGEAQAAKALRRRGYTIIGQRIRVGRRDEIDMVARHDNTLVFVEVKTRKTETFGRPAAAVTSRKRHCLSRAAVRYMRRMHPTPRCFRFDVVEVVGVPDGPPPVIRHIENAFALESRYRMP
ncbi:MAG: YraN family protein [Kiritimatiellia bacterium]|jgi:putative endonuclease